MLRALLMTTLAGATLASITAAKEIVSRAPAVGAPAQTWFRSESKSGLQFAWKIPKGYDAKSARNLTVILHGTGLDWQWGPANNPIDVFRPDDIVVSVDGTSPGQGTSRLFLGEKKDAESFAEFLAELRAGFSIDKTFLYGHSQGGFFVVYFAGEHPELVSGVVAHASGAWNWSKMGNPVKKVAIAFMHGTLDPVVSYGQSPGSRDAYEKAGFKLLHLRRLQNYNHWPNAVRATECLDWCEGMTTEDPAAALAAAERIVTPKKADQYQWETVVGFSAAHDVLRRFDAKGNSAFRELEAKVAASAANLLKRIEEHATKHVKVMQKDVSSKKDLKSSGDWLGHLVALREDFRGVEAVESYIKAIGYDDVLASQSKASGAIFKAWYGSGSEKQIFEEVVDNIDDAFLVEGYPSALAEKMEAWRLKAKSLDIDDKLLKRFAAFKAWQTGWQKGRESYEDVWKTWKGP